MTRREREGWDRHQRWGTHGCVGVPRVAGAGCSFHKLLQIQCHHTPAPCVGLSTPAPRAELDSALGEPRALLTSSLSPHSLWVPQYPQLRAPLPPPASTAKTERAPIT